jgi:hypothetical protein
MQFAPVDNQQRTADHRSGQKTKKRREEQGEDISDNLGRRCPTAEERHARKEQSEDPQLA